MDCSDGLTHPFPLHPPTSRAPAVRLKLRCRRPSGMCAPLACACRRGCGRRRADKRWRSSGLPCLILRRERVPC